MQKKDCTECATGKYANHELHECVSFCPAGKAPGVGSTPAQHKDCSVCPQNTPYADHQAHKCVQACPSGKAPGEGTSEFQRKDCTACPSGKFADHAAHQCTTTCSRGATGNNATRECGPATTPEVTPAPAP